MLSTDVDHLLLACLRSRYEPEALEEVEAAARGSEVDWEDFLGQAVRQSVVSLAYDALKGNSELLPPWVLGRLRAVYYQTAARNVVLHQELERLVSALAAAGIPVILLKGAALAPVVYRNVALRPMGDIDLLVPKDTMPAAEDMLSQQGYLLRDETSPHLRHTSFTRAGEGLVLHVEVHQHIVSSPYYREAIPEGWLWQKPVELLIGGTPGQMLAADAAITHSCLHFLDHTGTEGTLLWLWDIVEIVRNLDVDWDRLAQSAVDFRMTLPVRSVLLRCHDLLALPTPGQTVSKIISYRPDLVERSAYQLCLSPRRSTASKLLLDVLATRGFLGKIRLLSSRLFPSRDYMGRRYSIRRRWLVPLCHLCMLGAAVL